MLKTTDSSIVGGLSDDSEISLLSPVSTPRVLEDPIVSSIFSTVSNNEDSMIEISSTISTLDNSRTVRLENISISFNSNRNWL